MPGERTIARRPASCGTAGLSEIPDRPLVAEPLTGARIISQAVKELSAKPAGSRAIVSICTDGGQGSVVLLEAGQ